MITLDWLVDWAERDAQILSEDADRALMRVERRDGDNKTTALVVQPKHARSKTIVTERFESEYNLKAFLDASWAARPLEVLHQRGSISLALEDPGGYALADEIGTPMPLGRFLKVAIALADAVFHMHEAGLIHKDIKPQNFLIAASGDRAWLTGFGIASRLPRERQTPAPPEIIAGTLAYMAPEQTGRMNRSIDSRSDLYSLGVTFYQLLTGVLPFLAQDAMEWIHCHIARQPIAPAEKLPAIPAAVSSIIMKLMSKAAEDRYRTAAGLKSDLERCQKALETNGFINPFGLGSRDSPNKLLFREKLYGREEEIERLVATFNQVVTLDTPSLVLVSGYSGSGKSSVVNELHRPLAASHGLFAAGKFDQYKRGIPYAPLAQAFQGLIRQLLNKGEPEIERWREAFREALGANGGLLIHLVPELELIIGKQPTVPDLSGSEAQSRLRLVLRQFLGVFARPEHPLILFFDDLQWLDAASLDVFESLARETNQGSLLLVGAYRDNEVGVSHPLTSRLEAIRRSGTPVQDIVLSGIRLHDVTIMIAEALNDQPQRIGDLAQMVFEKTGGNPFFTTQFVTTLVDEGLLCHTDEGSAWCWDISKIATRHISDSVVDLMIERVRRLPETSQQALRQLACLGNDIKAGAFRRVVGSSGEEAQTLLRGALNSGLLLQIDDRYAFAHDRVHEAAYATIPPEEKGAMHWHLGSQLLATLDPAETSAEVFDVVSQFNRAQLANRQPEELVTVASLNLRAGRKAKASAAYAAASGYLAQGSKQLGEIGWKTHYDTTFALAMELAECTFLSGDLDTTERMIAGLLLRRLADVDKASVHRLKVELCVVRSDNRSAVESGLEGLKLLGFELTARPSWEDVEREYSRIWQKLRGRPIDFASLPGMTDTRALAAMRLLAEMQPPAYFSNFNTTILIICRMINLSLTHGASTTSAQGLVLLGYVMGPAFDRYKDGYRIAQLAGQLAAERNGPVDVARVDHLTGLAAAWTEPLPVALDWLRSAFRRGIEAGDLYYACFEAAVIVLHVFLSGEKLDDVASECRQALDFARDTGFQAGIDLVIATERAVASLRGRTRGLSDYNDETFDAAEFEANLARSQNTVVMWWYWTRRTMVHVMAGEYEQALAAAAVVRSQHAIRNMQIEQMDCHYYSGLALAALMKGAPADRRVAMRADLESHHTHLRNWAERTGSPTFADKHVLIGAEIARLDGRDLEAQRLYEESILLARENRFLQNEAVANETASRFYNDRGFTRISQLYLSDARLCYLRWGAHEKVRRLEEEYPQLRPEQSSTVTNGTTVGPVEQLDLNTVIKVAETVSGEIELDKLIHALMRTAMEHAGAGRAVLMLTYGANCIVEAEALMTSHGMMVKLRGELKEDDIPLPHAILQQALHSKETIILDNAVSNSTFSNDAYIVDRHVRSLLALPLVNQGNLVGLLFLENNLVANVFTSKQISVLKLIASQAALALENTKLYRDVAEREARIGRLVYANIIGVFMWKLDGQIFEANDLFLEMLGFDREDLVAGRIRWTDLSPPEERENDARIVEEVRATGIARPWEKEFFHKDGRRVPVLLGAATFGGPESDSGVAFIVDLSVRRQAEEAARASNRRNRDLQSELAHANRVATVGQMSAAISHELRQPLMGVVTSGSAGLNWLAAEPPNITAARRALERVVSEGQRAARVLERTRALVSKRPPKNEVFDMNSVILDTVALTREQMALSHVSLKMELDKALQLVFADRVQIQQVILNLIINALESMVGTDVTDRRLKIISSQVGEDRICVAVHDTGPGVPPDLQGKLFDAFYSTKPDGMGMGLAISRSIVESHGGKLWMTADEPHGAIFRLSLPAGQGASSL
jgi:PAS domain S-box-containing protein